jgi:hypothetical protein
MDDAALRGHGTRPWSRSNDHLNESSAECKNLDQASKLHRSTH